MTDLTRLLASLKRRSAHAKEFGHDVLFVKLEDIDALVEALEKAQKRNGELETYSKTALEFREAARDENRHLKLELEIAEKRIAGLEESHAQVIQSRDHYKRMSEEGLKQLAESRTVTVKLPEPYAYLRENNGQIQISIGAERPSDRSGGYATPWFAIYTAVGIKGAE
ncbi:hypothetical protein REX01_003448 [Klebsiella aerogenes]|nr:hypothetical protein [Klebsiella aerogenes]